MKTDPAKFQEYHREVVRELTAIGNPAFGEAVQKDRGSQLKHLGIKFPALRRRVKQGFSFHTLPDEQVLDVWNALWQTSPYGDVLFAALEFYAPIVRRQVHPRLWGVMRTWSKHVDNWCHSDGLSAIYSRILESHPEEVYPQLVKWNRTKSEWLRRISLVSLIHYSGRNAVFMPPKKVFPLTSNCLDDERYHVQTAVGWVLREMGNVYRRETTKYLESHIEKISSIAFSRAAGKMNAKEKARLRTLKSTK
jgi:3-methyladenine DNA glycosylase AlkD